MQRQLRYSAKSILPREKASCDYLVKMKLPFSIVVGMWIIIEKHQIR